MYLSSRFNDEKKIVGLYQRILLEQEEPKKIMDPATFAKFEEKLIRARYALYRDYPFFGLMLTKLRTVPTEDVPTMAVDDNSNIYINPDFVLNELSDAEVTGVLAHEVMHIATMTFFRLRGRNMKLWNIATDYMMNRDLLEMGIALPKLGLLPKQQGDRWIIQGQGLPPIDITDLTAEDLYNEFAQIAKKMPPKQPRGPGPGIPGGKPGDENAPQPEDILDILDKLAKKQEELDKHLTPEEAKKIQEEGDIKVPSDDENYKPGRKGSGDIKADIDNALETAKRTRGNDAGVPRSFAKDLLKPKANWKNLLRTFVKSASTQYHDWARPQKRALASGYYAPKIRLEQEDIDLVIAIDTSGSISEDIMKVFLTELMSIIRTFKNVKINLLLWHTSVYKEVDIDTRKKKIDDIQKELLNLPYQGGGTEISSIKKYLDKKPTKSKKITGLLVFTDGEVEDNPQFPDAKRKLFMITEGGTDEILKKYGPTFFVDVPHS